MLVVDDDPDIRESVTDALEGGGYRVVSAANGRDALKKVEISPPDLILSETVLPEMDGFAVMRELLVFLGIEPERVRVRVPYVGGGFGSYEFYAFDARTGRAASCATGSRSTSPCGWRRHWRIFCT